MRKLHPPFGEGVTRVLAEHGLSDRGGQYRTGIDRITIAEMRNGYVPRLEQVERFARGFNLDVNEWRVLAGYEPVSSGPDTDDEGAAGVTVLAAELAALESEYPEAGPLTAEGQAGTSLTPEAARRWAATIRELLEERYGPPAVAAPKAEALPAAREEPPPAAQAGDLVRRVFEPREASDEPTRPREWFWREFGRLSDTCQALGLPPLQPIRAHGGTESWSWEQAEAAITLLRQELAEEHPAHAALLRGEKTH